MELKNDELMIWNDKGNMIIKGEVVPGELVLTNRRMAFMTNEPPSILRARPRKNDLWELDINDVKDIDLRETQGLGFPLIRVRYRENDVFFTFPQHGPRETVAAMIIFLNHARIIRRTMDLMKNIEKGLKSDTLKVGDRLPAMMTESPRKADETCYQCGKTLLDEDLELLSRDMKECISCPADR